MSTFCITEHNKSLNGCQYSIWRMSQLITALGVVVMLALLVPGAANKNGARGQQAPGHWATSANVTCYGNYTSLHNHLQELCCDAISKYIRTGDCRHLAIYKSLALIIGGGGNA